MAGQAQQQRKGQIPGGALRCPAGVRCRLGRHGKVYGNDDVAIYEDDDG